MVEGIDSVIEKRPNAEAASDEPMKFLGTLIWSGCQTFLQICP